jgi:hypothetical protein
MFFYNNFVLSYRKTLLSDSSIIIPYSLILQTQLTSQPVSRKEMGFFILLEEMRDV